MNIKDPLSNLTEVQRLEYWHSMGSVDLALRRRIGNFVGERPDPRYGVHDFVRDHEAAYQRHLAMLAQYAAEDAAKGVTA